MPVCGYRAGHFGLGLARLQAQSRLDIEDFCVVALWEAFYIWNKRFDLNTLRVPNWSPTPISKSNDFVGQSDDISGARGPHFRPILGVPGARAGLKNRYVLALWDGHHVWPDP